MFIRSSYLALLMLGTTALADVIHVPDDQPSIGQAILVAQPGDTVLVADGIYSGPDNRDMQFLGKAITVRSENGPANCIIDCTQNGRAFFFEDEETPDSILDGFTITNGRVPNSNGGGIDMGLGASPTIRNCIFLNNSAEGLGGGMAVRGQCNPNIDRCTFIGNVCRGVGEGGNGGGLACFFLSNATVTNCVFYENEAEFGGGIDCGLSDAVFVNCLVFNNRADIEGGGVSISVANPTFINCTIVENEAIFDRGGGIVLSGYVLPSYPTITNSIIWGNIPDQIEVEQGEPTVTYCDVQGGWPGVGNINAGPEFIGSTLNADPAAYMLARSSPCIDAADNSAVPPDVEVDLAGDPRFVDLPEKADTGHGDAPIVDMGAYEFQVATIPADLDGDGDVDAADLALLLGAWGPCNGCSADLDGDGMVDAADLAILLGSWS